MVVLETPIVSVIRKEDCLNLVKFSDINEWYSLEEDIIIEFSLEPEMKGSTLDWIGLFQEGWNTFESFVTFQRGLGMATDVENTRKRRVKFPHSPELVSSILLECRYQFVYIDRYLDILGVSPPFRFILSLKNLTNESKSLTLAEEMLISENQFNGRNYLSHCRYHRNSNHRNMVTTCNHCRPCGHDYYSIKEKAELTYSECLRLSDRLSHLESEVALQSLKMNRDTSGNENHVAVRPDDQISLENISNDKKLEVCDKLSTRLHCSVNDKPDCSQEKIFKAPYENDLPQKDQSCKPITVNHSEKVILRCNKKDASLRSLSFPQESASSNSHSCSKYLNLRKTSSDRQLTLNESCPLSDVDSPLILKAIIGHQEERIRRLTQLLNQKRLTEETDDSDEGSVSADEREEQVVKLVRTEQRMLAQILRINNNCQEFSNEKDLIEKQSHWLQCDN